MRDLEPHYNWNPNETPYERKTTLLDRIKTVGKWLFTIINYDPTDKKPRPQN
jgi:hypothetical protein